MKSWWMPLSLYFSLCVVMFIFQKNLLYFPTPMMDSNHWQIIKNEKEILGITKKIEDKTNIVIFHGNAGNASMREYYIDFFGEAYNVIIFEYPGYGLNYQEATTKKDMIRRTRLL